MLAFSYEVASVVALRFSHPAHSKNEEISKLEMLARLAVYPFDDTASHIQRL